ncbi:DsrE family protein [Rhizorhabdus sp. FW153]|uniref:DsrE family protein n=1 Tax=Rhizorhabdus sp. FW153 TaxID=3400216 RepID=UPI003CF26FE0
MRGLILLVASGDPERLHAALSLAAAAAASGRDTSVHLHELAVGLLAAPLIAPSDTRRQAVGLPTLAQIFEEALELRVVVSVCQSGLALHDLSLDRLDARIDVRGPVSIVTTNEEKLVF